MGAAGPAAAPRRVAVVQLPCKLLRDRPGSRHRLLQPPGLDGRHRLEPLVCVTQHPQELGHLSRLEPLPAAA